MTNLAPVLPDDALRIARHPAGRGFRLTTQVRLPRPRSEVFAFFADAYQLERITPPWLNFRIVRMSSPAIGAGTLIDYQLRLHGVPLRWRTRIRVWEPEERFVDEQLSGPYRWWRHEHTFVEREGFTDMTDTVDYGVPWSFLAHPLLVRRDLRRIFAFRHREMLRLFEASAADVSGHAANSG